METSKLSKLIADYIQTRKKVKLKAHDKKAKKKLSALANHQEKLIEAEKTLAEKRHEISSKHEPNAWLTKAASRAKQISLVTHGLKFSHTDAKGSSILLSKGQDNSESDDYYISTYHLKDIQIDVVGNAATLDVAGLLLLEVDDVRLIDLLAQDDVSALLSFAENHEQLESWLSSFKQVLMPKTLSSHTLAKQIFFPITDNEYHLLSPLYASSLSQALYDRITESRFSDEAKSARKAKRENHYHHKTVVIFPNIAIQIFGGNQSQNVSQLNSKRAGNGFLLNCEPPPSQWERQKYPPSSHKKAVWRIYEKRVWQTVNQFTKFLYKSKKLNNKDIRNKSKEYIDEMIEVLINYACEIQELHQFRGWSINSKLSYPEQLWLDPYFNDSNFQNDRATNTWQNQIVDQFATWLNNQLKKKQLDVSDDEYHVWYKLFKQRLIEAENELAIKIERHQKDLEEIAS